MQTLQTDYFATYRNLKLSRDAKGVLVAEFHSDGGPFIMNAQAHTEFVDAFHRIGQDRANKIVIMTGAGGSFIGDVEWPSFGDVAERSPVDIRNELPARARQDYDLVRSILPDPVEGLDKLRVSLRVHSERSAVVVKFGNQNTFGIPSQF